MNSTRTTTLLSITLSAVLLTGIIAPAMPKAFAGEECIPFGDASAQDDICFPDWFDQPNTVSRIGFLTGFGDGGDCSSLDPAALPSWPTDPAFTGSEDTSNFDLFGDPASISFDGDGAHVFMPNLIDELPLKDIRIQATFCQIDDSTGFPFITNMQASEGECGFWAAGSAPADTVGGDYFFEDWACEPNPDWETFDIDYEPSEWVLVQLVFDSRTYGEVVGGIFEGVNTPALLVAGAQANALWLIPLITAIGVGFVIVKRKF